MDNHRAWFILRTMCVLVVVQIRCTSFLDVFVKGSYASMRLVVECVHMHAGEN